VPPRSWAGFDAEACPGRFQSVRKPAVPAYHEASLGELIAPVGQAIDSFRAGELDAFAVDHALYQYSRAAKKSGSSAACFKSRLPRGPSLTSPRSTGASGALPGGHNSPGPTDAP
jgi:hypothetical protein